ncbi:MAG: hypothetical protein EA390_10690 [Balneolaceae bacterium]|nr:MAG: hypothetical protein EA390_10690 [Balneolaceae bacterium]
MWSQILLIISSLLSVYFILSRVPESRKDIKLLGTITCFSVFSHELLHILEVNYYQIVTDYLSIGIYSLLLIIILITVRLHKPEYARYPYLFVFTPILILLFFPFIQGTDVLTSLILKLIQAGCIISLLLIIIAHFELLKRGWQTGLSIFLLATSYLIFWFLSEQYDQKLWMWQPQLAVSMLLLAVNFPYIYYKNDE